MSKFSNSEQDFLRHYDPRAHQGPIATVDVAIFTVADHELRVLLVKRAQHPERGRWALPGGFINVAQDQTLDDTARRKLRQKTGVDTPYLEQVATFGNADRDPRAWSLTIAYFALLDSQLLSLMPDDSAEEVAWVEVGEATRTALAFDHNAILEFCWQRLKSKVSYSNLPVHLLPAEFTLPELQEMYEIIMGSSVEKKSFRRRLLAADILKPTGSTRKTGTRPAKLYTLKEGEGRYFFSRAVESPI